MRTALINKIRGLAKAFGILIGPGKGGPFVRQVWAQLPDDQILIALFETVLTLLGTFQERSHEIAKQLARVARQNKICRLMMTTPGVSPITAISFVTTIEDPMRFRRSRMSVSILASRHACISRATSTSMAGSRSAGTG